MKILITGAAGFIGSHMVRALVNRGNSVLPLDNFADYYSVDYKRLRVRELHEDPNQLQIVDISDRVALEQAFSSFKPEYVIHLAAQAGVRLSLNQSQIYISSNIEGFYNVLCCAEDYGVKGFIYASSSSVYGDSTPTPYSETSLTLRPKSIYGVSKLTNEMFAEIQARKSNMRFRGLRFFTVYGPWGRPDMAYFRIVSAALGESSFSLFGDGKIKRDFTFIDDVVDTSIRLLDDLTTRGKGFADIVNIGGSRPLDMNYLIELVQKQTKSIIAVNKENPNPLDSEITMADQSYLTSILGEQKFTPLEDGVERLVSWAKDKEIKQHLRVWIENTK